MSLPLRDVIRIVFPVIPKCTKDSFTTQLAHTHSTQPHILRLLASQLGLLTREGVVSRNRGHCVAPCTLPLPARSVGGVGV